MEQEFINPQNKTYPTRLDMKTKMTLAACLIFGMSFDCKGMEDAVDIAFEIDELVSQRVRKLKRENPAPRRPVTNSQQKAA